MTSISDIENILQTYELTEVFELNDLTDEDVLFYLVEQEFVTLPAPKPL